MEVLLSVFCSTDHLHWALYLVQVNVAEESVAWAHVLLKPEFSFVRIRLWVGSVFLSQNTIKLR